jgi:hypothetical protein
MAQQHGGTPHEAGYAEPIDITPLPAGDDRADAPAQWPGDSEGTTVPLAPRRSSRTRHIVLASLLVVGLAGAAVLGTAGARIIQQKDAVLEPPDSVAGLTRDDSDTAAETADYLRTALAAGVDLDETVAVVYADPADDGRSVLFFGGTALLFSPGRELDGALDLLGDRGSAPSDLREVPAGDLGGVMKCGTVTVPEGSMSVCGWADHGSVAVAMFPERAVKDAAPLMRELRQATQTRA